MRTADAGRGRRERTPGLPSARSRRPVGFPETPGKPMRRIFLRVVMAVTEAGVTLPNTVWQHSDGGDNVQTYRIDHRKHGLRLGDLPWFHDRRVRTPRTGPKRPTPTLSRLPRPDAPAQGSRRACVFRSGHFSAPFARAGPWIPAKLAAGARLPAGPGNNDRRQDRSRDRFPGAGLATPSMHPFPVPRPLPLQLLDRLHDPPSTPAGRRGCPGPGTRRRAWRLRWRHRRRSPSP